MVYFVRKPERFICTILFALHSQNPFLELRKLENMFYLKVGKSFCNYCLSLKYAPLCQIWSHYHEICLDNAMNLVICLESHEWSYMILWRFFKEICHNQFFHFPRTSTPECQIMFLLFYFLFCFVSKQGQNHR